MYKVIHLYPISLIKSFFINLGKFSLFLFKTFRTIKYWKIYLEYTVEQIFKLGLQSIPIIILTTLFSGMVIAVNFVYQVQDSYSVPTDIVGSIVGNSVLIELSPMMIALVMTGKIGATITAELGSMRVTEQIDALESLSFDPLGFLVFPRIVASIIIFPLFIIIGNYCGVWGGMWASTQNMQGLSSVDFWNGLETWYVPWNATFGVIKGTIFGFTITSVACYKGYYIEGGAQGVGKATSDTVIISCVAIVILNFLLGTFLL